MRKNWKTIVNSGLILLLIILVGLMMLQIRNLQGTARVLNYAGLVRGATQREVKLEITGTENDELIQYLDDILSGLKYEDGHYDLVKLKDENYQQKLDVQMNYWQSLKREIHKVRANGYEQTDIVAMSETYFGLADDTVSAAERYSEQIATRIRWIEIASAVDMVLLAAMVIEEMLSAIRIARKNKVLEQKAYIDLHTGLPNKSRCEELLNDVEFITEPTACLMFDLNNLKHVNDTMGHSVGDQLIANFARLLRNAVPAKDFVGRYGGDEFIAVLYNTDRRGIKNVLLALQEDVDDFNSHGRGEPISFAWGWALSSDYSHCTLQTLFDAADKYMYTNKQRTKQGRQD